MAEQEFKDIKCRYKGLIPLCVYKMLLLENIFKGSFCEHNMEHKEQVSKVLDKYLKQYKKLSKAYKNSHKDGRLKTSINT